MSGWFHDQAEARCLVYWMEDPTDLVFTSEPKESTIEAADEGKCTIVDLVTGQRYRFGEWQTVFNYDKL